MKTRGKSSIAMDQDMVGTLEIQLDDRCTRFTVKVCNSEYIRPSLRELANDYCTFVKTLNYDFKASAQKVFFFQVTANTAKWQTPQELPIDTTIIDLQAIHLSGIHSEKALSRWNEKKRRKTEELDDSSTSFLQQMDAS